MDRLILLEILKLRTVSSFTVRVIFRQMGINSAATSCSVLHVGKITDNSFLFIFLESILVEERTEQRWCWQCPQPTTKKTLPTKYCRIRNQLLHQFRSSWRITDTCNCWSRYLQDSKLYTGERKKNPSLLPFSKL